MSADPQKANLEGLLTWASQLACPACLGALQLEAGGMACRACGRSYPIENGIPVLIVERAIQAP